MNTPSTLLLSTVLALYYRSAPRKCSPPCLRGRHRWRTVQSPDGVGTVDLLGTGRDA